MFLSKKNIHGQIQVHHKKLNVVKKNAHLKERGLAVGTVYHHLPTTTKIHLASLAPLSAGRTASVPVCFHPPGTPQLLFAEEQSPNLDLS